MPGYMSASLATVHVSTRSIGSWYMYGQIPFISFSPVACVCSMRLHESMVVSLSALSAPYLGNHKRTGTPPQTGSHLSPCCQAPLLGHLQAFRQTPFHLLAVSYTCLKHFPFRIVDSSLGSTTTLENLFKMIPAVLLCCLQVVQLLIQVLNLGVDLCALLDQSLVYLIQRAIDEPARHISPSSHVERNSPASQVVVGLLVWWGAGGWWERNLRRTSFQHLRRRLCRAVK
jgi:hypothetical protein